MLKKANHGTTFLLRTFKEIDLLFKLNPNGGNAKYSQTKHGSEEGPIKNDLPTVSEIRKRFGKILGVEPGFKAIKENRSYLLEYLPQSQEELPPRSIKDSFQSAIIPLSSNLKLQERYVNVMGYVRFGRLLEDMDMFAAWVGMNYVSNPKQPLDALSPYNLVTILVDHITVTEYNAKWSVDIRISGHVSSAGKTSIETTIWLEQEQEGIWHRLTTATFLMAARNVDLSKGAFVNRLVPADDEEKLIAAKGEARKILRAELDRGSVFTHGPGPEEQRIIHKLFLETISTTSYGRVLPPGSVWMADTRLTNIIFSNTEDRNLHNTVFGGFLMRNALEMAWFVGYFHCKHRPRLRNVSDISFKKPVAVGSILSFHGQVVYTDQSYMQIFVHGDVTNPFTGQQCTSIVFHFTYESPELVRPVKPNTYYEALRYVDGRRHFLEAASQRWKHT